MTAPTLREAQSDYARAFPHTSPEDLVLLHGMGRDILLAADCVSLSARHVDGNDTRPSVADLAQRMVEAIDDQISPEAWIVIEAAIRFELDARAAKMEVAA